MKISKNFAADMSNVVAERNLDPPEYADPVEEVDQGFIEVPFSDVEIEIKKDGSWDYLSLDLFDGPAPRGSWRIKGTEFNLTLQKDRNSVVEDIDSLIEPMLPAEPGFYYISGDAYLMYDVDISYYADYEEPEEGDIDVSFDYQNSEVNNFTCVRH